jgi:hypothetical protein
MNSKQFFDRRIVLIDKKRACAGGLVLLLASNAAVAAESGDDGWRFLAVPYLWVASLDGETGVGTTSNLHWSFEDIVQHLDMGFMGQFEAHKSRFGFVLSPIYLDLTKNDHPVAGLDLKAGLEAEIVEAFATWECMPGLELLAGARYTNVDVKVRISTPTAIAVDQHGNKKWTDAIAGARYAHDFDDRWSLGVRGDVGGTGMTSDFAWNGTATVSYKVGESGRIYAGYRVLDYNYVDGSGANRFTFNIRLDGPVIGYGMTF